MAAFPPQLAKMATEAIEGRSTRVILLPETLLIVPSAKTKAVRVAPGL